MSTNLNGSFIILAFYLPFRVLHWVNHLVCTVIRVAVTVQPVRARQLGNARECTRQPHLHSLSAQLDASARAKAKVNKQFSQQLAAIL